MHLLVNRQQPTVHKLHFYTHPLNDISKSENMITLTLEKTLLHSHDTLGVVRNSFLDPYENNYISDTDISIVFALIQSSFRFSLI